MKFNAKKAEHDYITDNSMSYRKLAEKYKVNTATITKYAKKGEWVKKREKYQTKVAQRAIEKTAEKESDKLATLTSATDKAIEVVAEFINTYDDDSAFRYKNFKDVVATLKELTALQRNLNGILTKKEEIAFAFAEEKLKHEKARNSSDEKEQEETGIVVIPALVSESSENIVIEGEIDV
ncbi:MAG: hypothetical protein NC213_09970 [Acetobacter sp.]|nr:hypothetical protein [Bacteroides sp.]MCM1342059.1 hypothetical protein [Acetobacter sp.]MCM1434255.1 hypothetical protein [Clostridiales bacterium]